MRLHRVGRRYGMAGPWVLRGVDAELPAGALLRVEGANGSGKSTLLRLLAGVDAPSTGRITGRPRSAYVPERFPAGLPLTAASYLTHLGRVRGLRRGEAVREAGELLERFDAAAYLRTPLSALSKGGSQKVAVAQALLGRPGLIVLDEAWTGLDPASRAVLDDVVTERVARGATVVFVDHDPRRLAGAAHATYRLTDGQLAPVARESPAPPLPESAVTRIVAVGPPGTALDTAGLPGRPAVEREPGGALRLAVPPERSDALLHALLTGQPPWHIRSVAQEAPARERPQPENGPTPAPGREPRLAQLVRYQLALLLRSQRWLPPLLLYAALLAVGVQPGQPLLDGFGYAAAMLLPVAAWTARVCVTGEPEAARHCVAAAAGPRRAHLGALLAALAASLVLGLAGTLYAALSGEPHSTGGAVAVPPLASAGAGLSATVTCALTGTAVGALCARPLVRGTGRAVPALLAGVLLALVNPASPANAAVRALTAGSREGTVPAPWLPLALSALLAAAACAVTAWLAPRRNPTSAG